MFFLHQFDRGHSKEEHSSKLWNIFIRNFSLKAKCCQAPWVIEVAARYFAKFDKAQRDKLLIIEDPSLMFLIVKVARDQRVPGSLLARFRR